MNQDELFSLTDTSSQKAEQLVVFGVGGGGGNALNHIIESNVMGVDFVAANTDRKALESNRAPNRILLGEALTRGLGAGANPATGAAAAKESIDKIREYINGADMLFVTAGMGGGTGTGAAPIIAEAAKEMGVLVVGVVTKPFGFEMRKRMSTAEEGIAQLKKNVDALLIVENQKLLELDNGLKMKIVDAYKKVDEVLRQAVQGVTDLITKEGFINLDFADIKTILKAPENGGATIAIMGMGEGEGEGRARKAAEQAIHSPLMTLDLSGAKGMLLNVTTGPEITLEEMTQAADIIQSTADEDAQVIWGHVIDESLGDKVRVTLIATFPEGAQAVRKTSGATGGTVGGTRIPGSGTTPAGTGQTGGRIGIRPPLPPQPTPPQPLIRTGNRTLADLYNRKKNIVQEDFQEASLGEPSEESAAFPGGLKRSYDQPAYYRTTGRN
ncbi:MAG: cell division protein FtsZ [Synergistaceae bacterium]|nr:cell division protein FtsZ [Synergistaceae bacterium]